YDAIEPVAEPPQACEPRRVLRAVSRVRCVIILHVVSAQEPIDGGEGAHAPGFLLRPLGRAILSPKVSHARLAWLTPAARGSWTVHGQSAARRRIAEGIGAP